jgi:hypothetical protein
MDDTNIPDIVKCDIESFFLVPATVHLGHCRHGPEDTQQTGGKEGGLGVCNRILYPYIS